MKKKSRDWKRIQNKEGGGVWEMELRESALILHSLNGVSER